VLSQDPWRSVDGYVGHSAGVQFLALVSTAALAASTVAERTSAPEKSPESRTQAHVRQLTT
jgi:arabinofuranan 3-O-arabinosyltransferase